MSTSGGTTASKHDISISATMAWHISFSQRAHLYVPFNASKGLKWGKKRILSHTEDNPISHAPNL